MIERIKKHRYLPVLLFLCLHCGPGRRSLPFQGNTMGTTYHVKVEVSGEVDQKAIAEGIQAALDEVNQLMSNWVSGSDVSRFNQLAEGQWQELNPLTATVIANALDVAARSEGRFDPTVGPLIDLWGFGTGKSGHFPDDEAVAAAKAQIGYHHITLEGNRLSKDVAGLTLNLGANAKGFGVDRVAEWLLAQGFNDFMVEVGGEVRVSASKQRKKPWRIGINDPNSPLDGHLLKVAKLRQGALATSGDYMNYFLKDGIRYSHIINPRTGHPIPAQVTSVSVIASSCMMADALATALMVLPPQEGLALIENMPGIECLIITRDADDHLEEQQTPGMAPYLD